VLLRWARPTLRACCAPGDPGAPDRFAAIAGKMYLKNAVLATEPPQPGAAGTSYHLCEDGVCSAPIPDEQLLSEALAKSACTPCAAVN